MKKTIKKLTGILLAMFIFTGCFVVMAQAVNVVPAIPGHSATAIERDRDFA